MKSFQTICLSVLPERFAVCRYRATDKFIKWIDTLPLVFVSRTHDEMTVICNQDAIMDSDSCDDDWRCFKLKGVFEFDVSGILHALTRPLAQAEIPVLVMSAFSTDYLFVKADNFSKAVEAFKNEGIQIET